jgi:hypothetical protein
VPTGEGRFTRIVFASESRCYTDEPDRLFAHPIVDGFQSRSDFRKPSLDRCAAVVVALMREMTANGRVARALSAEGALSII